jgi:hypothetical protein
VIGERGATLREVGRQAREDMERLLDRKVFLETWVKVREGWSDDERALLSLGYADPGTGIESHRSRGVRRMRVSAAARLHPAPPPLPQYQPVAGSVRSRARPPRSGGARCGVSPRSRLKGLLQPFAPLLLSWTGAGELATLTAAEEAGRPAPLPPNRVLAGLYANELLVRLLPRQDPQPGLFAAYQTLLAELAAAPGEEPPLRRFEKKLLEDLGYGLTLDREAASGAPIVAEERYRYVLDRGPLARRARPGPAYRSPAGACWRCATVSRPTRPC